MHPGTAHVHRPRPESQMPTPVAVSVWGSLQGDSTTDVWSASGGCAGRAGMRGLASLCKPLLVIQVALGVWLSATPLNRHAHILMPASSLYLWILSFRLESV